jgi:hypothetical protein
MTIGTAIVIVFILYLIDKHNLWRLFALVVVALVMLSAVGAGSYFGWHAWRNHRAERTPFDLSAGFIPAAPAPLPVPPPKGFILDQNFLVQIVRLKYPTQYRDLSDTELGARVLKKYPQCATLLQLPESPGLQGVSSLPDDLSEICRIYESANPNHP